MSVRGREWRQTMGRKRKPKIEPLTLEDEERFREQANTKFSTCIYWNSGTCYYADDTCGFADGEDYMNTRYPEKEEKKECCGTCRYHVHEGIDDGWVCVNDTSLYCADWTEYDFCCDDYEGS